VASPAEPVLSFVIPVKNDATRLRNCLTSIGASQPSVATEIIVVDNGSTDDSAAVARSFGARVLDMPEGRVSALRNYAAHLAAGPYIAFVDADNELGPGWSRSAVEILKDSSIAAAGAPYHAPNPGTWVQSAYDLFRPHRPGTRPAMWLPSGNLVVRKTAFEQLGGFDAELETCEDVDFCQRLRASGGRLVASERLRSVHRGDPTTLRALFLGELWRGRDNLRVTLREPLSWRSTVGLLVTLGTLAALAALPIGLVTSAVGGRWLALAGALALLAVVALRSVMLLANAESRVFSLKSASQVVVVAAVYDVARALALITSAGHQSRRKA
jgi:GT2 family glycosyltransferase